MSPMKVGTIRWPLVDRIKKKVAVDATTGCWIWEGSGSKSIKDTGKILAGGVCRSVRTVAHEVFIGPVPKGMTVMQRCGNIKCICPEHLFTGRRDSSVNALSVRQRFTKKCSLLPNENGCILWTGAKGPKGYGQMMSRYADVENKAHRLAYVFAFGEIPVGLHVLHRCDTPSCVNPEHLFLGTNKDNVDDKVSKGRSMPGEQCPVSKLKDHEVAIIKRRLLCGDTLRAIAGDFNVHHATIFYISKGGWRHISPAPISGG